MSKVKIGNSEITRRFFTIILLLKLLVNMKIKINIENKDNTPIKLSVLVEIDQLINRAAVTP
jgi:hypothetical protein